jgi:8-oxo-dGTP diphosphatase
LAVNIDICAMKHKPAVLPELPDGDDLLPGVSVDCAIFGFHDGQLKLLLLKLKNNDVYALPGGFVQKNENLDTAAARVLKERTGLENIYLEQFYTFGDVNRRNNKTQKEIFRKMGIGLSDDHWLQKRFVTAGYYALVDFSTAIPVADELSDSCGWYDLPKVPALMYDHNAIAEKALKTLQLMLDHKLVGFNLLPEKFTMNDLQQLYETILSVKLTRANFQRKILAMNILERVEKKMEGGAHKAPYLYRFSKKKHLQYIRKQQ